MGNVEYVRPTWDRFEAWLDDNYEWEEIDMDGVGERVVALPLPAENKEIRIFTTVNKHNDDGRDKGSDAIRTVIWDTEFDVPVGGREYTKRIKTKKDPIRYLRNMHNKVQWLYHNWHAFDHDMRCPKCESTLRGGSSEYGEYLFCTNDDCDYTENLPDKSCPECKSGMKFVEDGPYGDYHYCLNDDCDHTEDA